jgi:hypothetical protein
MDFAPDISDFLEVAALNLRFRDIYKLFLTSLIFHQNIIRAFWLFESISRQADLPLELTTLLNHPRITLSKHCI